MNPLDVLIVLAALVAAAGGFRLGFIARSVSWAGTGIGLLVGAWLVPVLARALDGASDLTVLVASVGLLVGAAFAGQAIGMLAGSRLRVAVPEGAPRRADQAFGALAGVAGVLVVVWLLLPALATVPEWPAEQARRSVVAGRIDELFPAAPDALGGLGRLVGDDRFPEVFAGLEPAPDVGAPPAASGLSLEAAERVRRSTVKVLGEACGRIQEGSGFVAEPGVVVTNAHVVAGTGDLVVERSDGSRADAEVVAFDPATDLAVLEVPGLDRPALPLEASVEGARGGVFGYPGGGELEVSPFEVARATEAVGTDIYDDRPTRRQVLFLAAELAPGDSGGALVEPDGDVVGLAFAIAPDRPGVAYALDAAEVAEALDGPRRGSTSTGSCI